MNRADRLVLDVIRERAHMADQLLDAERSLETLNDIKDITGVNISIVGTAGALATNKLYAATSLCPGADFHLAKQIAEISLIAKIGQLKRELGITS